MWPQGVADEGGGVAMWKKGATRSRQHMVEEGITVAVADMRPSTLVFKRYGLYVLDNIAPP